MKDHSIDRVVKHIGDNGPLSIYKGQSEDLLNDAERAWNLEYLSLEKKRGGNQYRLTKKGQMLYDNGFNHSLLDESRIEVKAENAHIGNNYGTYNQGTHRERESIIKKVIVGIAIAVGAGLILWLFGVA